ncbi:hypothetical protein A2U01_0000042 [Trifolium medium]|uniref:Uncharacterized protein n=1 Tax=Trifolium medium TaxID=97028 RepID=A0A392LWF8_9FABA|nr:hypothetical protein [Trifolium medium]
MAKTTLCLGGGSPFQLMRLVSTVKLTLDQASWWCTVGVEGIYMVKEGYAFLVSNVPHSALVLTNYLPAASDSGCLLCSSHAQTEDHLLATCSVAVTV